VISDSGEEEIQYIVFDETEIDLINMNGFFIPTGEVHICVWNSMLVTCFDQDPDTADPDTAEPDDISKTALPLNVLNTFDNAAFFTLNMANLEGLTISKDSWLETVVAPLLIVINDEGRDIADSKASDAFDLVKELKAKGFNKFEIQSLLYRFNDLDGFIELRLLLDKDRKEDIRALT